MTSSQRSEDLSGAPAATGVPGTASTLPRPTSRPGQGARGLTRKTENIAYQSSRRVRRVRTPQGVVKRMSVALLVDHSVRWEGPEGKAKRIVEAPSEDKLKAIRELVAGAIGLQTDRGDQLIVSLPSIPPKWKPEPEAPATPAPTSFRLPSWLTEPLKNVKILAVGGAAVVVLLVLSALFVLIVVRKRRRKRKARVEAGQKALPSGSPVPPEMEATAAVQEKLQERLAEQQALGRLEETLKSFRHRGKTKKSEVLSSSWPRRTVTPSPGPARAHLAE
jgi:flagellar M-ring protein FliF